MWRREKNRADGGEIRLDPREIPDWLPIMPSCADLRACKKRRSRFIYSTRGITYFAPSISWAKLSQAFISRPRLYGLPIRGGAGASSATLFGVAAAPHTRPDTRISATHRADTPPTIASFPHFHPHIFTPIVNLTHFFPNTCIPARNTPSSSDLTEIRYFAYCYLFQLTLTYHFCGFAILFYFSTFLCFED